MKTIGTPRFGLGADAGQRGSFAAGIVAFLAVLAAMSVFSAQAAPPTITSVTPSDGATGVAPTAGLVFVFNQDMDTTSPLIPSITGLVGSYEFEPASVSSTVLGTWGADQRTLTLKPFLQFPIGTIKWKLNPAGSFFPIKSKAGEALATVSGGFTTGGNVVIGAKLASVSPLDGAMDVPVTAAVVFTFDQVMKTDTDLGGAPGAVGAVSWTGTGVDPLKFTYSWSADGKTLTCDYLGDLPAGRQVSWQINPGVATVKLQAPDGKAAATTSGQFKTAGGVPGCDTPGFPSNWSTYSLYKNANREQTSAADPLPSSEGDAFLFSAVISGASVTSASVTRPGNITDALQSLGGVAQFYSIPDTEAELQSQFPAGTYTLRFTPTGQAERVVAMNMPVGLTPTPKIVNWDEAHAVDAGADFTLRWNAFSGAGVDDSISLYISDSLGHILFLAPDPCVPRELPVTATSIVIPADTLSRNVTYNASITFAHLFYHSTNDVPQMAGFGDLITSTRFTIATGGDVNPPPSVPAVLAGGRLLPNGNPQFDLTGSAGRAYAVQRASGLGAPVWTEAGTVTMDGAGKASFEDTQAGKVFPLFYRAVLK